MTRPLWIGAVGLGIILNACVNAPAHKRSPVIVSSQPKTGSTDQTGNVVTVKAGDTLYSIAWRHGMDYRELAKLNGIGSDWRIEIGQVLKLKANAHSDTESMSEPRVNPGSNAFVDQTKDTTVDPPPRFEWPVPAKHPTLLQKPSGGAGIVVDGVLGEPVKAAANGTVVYAGLGLARSYGALVIVKHNESWLTAYGYNQQLLVKEGDGVKQGQAIAKMGDNGRGAPQLYFEIRRQGKPVNPLEWLK